MTQAFVTVSVIEGTVTSAYEASASSTSIAEIALIGLQPTWWSSMMTVGAHHLVISLVLMLVVLMVVSLVIPR